MKKTLLTSAILMALSSGAFATDFTFKNESELQKQLANITNKDNVTINYEGAAVNSYYGAALHDSTLNLKNLNVTSTNKGLFPHMNHHVVINAEGNVNVDSSYWAAIHLADDKGYENVDKSVTIDAKGNVAFNNTVWNNSKRGSISITAGNNLTVDSKTGHSALRNDVADTTITANAKNITLKSDGYGAWANGGDISITAEETLDLTTTTMGHYPLYADGEAVLDVKAGTGIVNGNIGAGGTSQIYVDFGSEKSEINGRIVKGANARIDVTMNGGSWNAQGSNKLSNLNGSVIINGDKDTVITADAANAVLINSKLAGTFNVNEGNVELRAEGAEGSVTVETATIGDSVKLSATADGAFNDKVGGDVEKAKKAFKFGDYLIDTVKLEEGNLFGAVINGVQQVNKKTEALADKVTLAPQMITRIMMNDLRKRMGDIRAGEGTHGAWARYNGGQMAGDGVDADFHMVQVGIDTVPVVDAPRFGVAFSYAQTEADDVYGTTDMDSYSLAVYGTKMHDNGMFVDVIGRMATMDTDMVNGGAKGKMDNVALSLSGELGWRFDVTDRFFIEPSVEATYTYTNADTFTMTNGVTYELEATDSLVGRAGFAAGFKCPANKGDVYVRAAVVHEFMGDTTMNSWNATYVGDPIEADGEDTYFEYAIGAQFNVNKNTYVYADVERTEGAAMDEDWRANVGVRFAF